MKRVILDECLPKRCFPIWNLSGKPCEMRWTSRLLAR